VLNAKLVQHRGVQIVEELSVGRIHM
jgi:hypothetical protein